MAEKETQKGLEDIECVLLDIRDALQSISESLKELTTCVEKESELGNYLATDKRYRY
jgi:hypothetical protein